ncbi:MAG: hypothetical protein KGZ83_21285 [Sulfuricella sp.]|nr:hypothetical protein [Sulfuricella sp.]
MRKTSAQRGFILIYVIGILVFLELVGLGVAYALRVNAQQVINDKEGVQNEMILGSALQFAAAQAIKTRLAEPMVATLPKEESAKLVLWKMGMGPYLANIHGRDVEIYVEDGGDLPDINALTKEDIQRIFRALGAREDEAATLADTLVKAREIIGRARDANGFATMEQLLELEFLPPRYKFGGASEESGKPEAMPGLIQLVTVGTGMRSVSLNTAPLAVIGALCNADAAKMEKFATARAAAAAALPPKKLTLAEAAQILGEIANQVLRDSATTLYRFRVRMAQGKRIYEATALAKEDGKSFNFYSYRFTQTGE